MHSIQTSICGDGDLSRRAVRVLATQYFLLCLREHLNWCSLDELQRKLLLSSRSKCLYKNMRGAPIRSSALKPHSENVLPGSWRILKHPLWMILQKPNASIAEVHDYMKMLHPDIVRRAFSVDKRTGELVRKKPKGQYQIDAIVENGTLDAIAYSLMLTREMELTGSTKAYVDAKWAVHMTFQMMLIHQAFMLISSKLYELIYQLFIKINNPLPEDAQNFSVKFFPTCFIQPERLTWLRIVEDTMHSILWHAECRGLINNSLQNKYRFMYAMLLKQERVVIETQLKNLPHSYRFDGDLTQLEPELRSLMVDFLRDRRARLIPDFLVY